MLIGQTQGPLKEPGSTVARPRKSTDSKTGNEEELPKIPSKLKKDPADDTRAAMSPSSRRDVDIVTIDVAVVDNKGHFIPGIPPGNFRLLEDNVPQQLRKVDMGEAPMTIAMVIEFSNLFQRYWSAAWYQTLQLAWGFAESLKPEDYCRGSCLRHTAGDPDGFHHGQEQDPRRARPVEDRGVLRSQHVRRGHRHGGSHERDRRPQSDPADHQRHRHFQQDHLRPDAQEAAGGRCADLLHRPDADAARNGRSST